MKPTNDLRKMVENVEFGTTDIEITGKLGSSSIKWLIECRDRPSEGSAPVAWIEQLVGRRDRFNFDKVTAVSTTGFSPGAQEFALQKGIELRTVKDLSPESIRSWFQTSSMKLTIHRGELILAEINIDENSSDDAEVQLARQVVELKSTKSNLDVPFLICTTGGVKHSFREAWNQVMNATPQLFDRLETNGNVRRRLVQVSYSNPHECYMLQAGMESVRVVRIDYHADVSIIEKDIPISDIAEYVKTQGNESIAQSIRFVADTDANITWEFALHRIQDTGAIMATATRIAENASGDPRVSRNA